ncbi:DUF5681 domain-containing protein [Azospirillum sp. TSO22-1]|uniref:DUF5681 domain-containing protein n=1 Tax=Azospirillum sp. TSO22-1 TaxID=716789 RepID=UPI000D61252E|nr:DUF5681 domain-containing protein [Azospirillum sp. TSO22-1]PWC53612.1 hypothetical protein TSO221_10310 [Azospirillum sp. TSO22-1]
MSRRRSPAGTEAEEAKRDRRGRFAPGNPGRRPGSRNKATLAAEQLLDGEADALTRKAIELAKAGDVQALRLCLERLLPARKDRPVRFTLPPLSTAADAAKAVSAIVEAVAGGDLTPGEAAELGKLIETYTKTLEAAEFETRLAALEERSSKT